MSSDRCSVMEWVALAQYCGGTRLCEAEAWALLSEACQVISQKISNLEDGVLVGQSYEDFILNAERLQLSAGGQVSISNAKLQNVRELLPVKMKPLLELTIPDLARIGLFSLAKVILANIEDIKSKDLLGLLARILRTELASIPRISQVIQFSLKIITRNSARRMISSMFYKYQGLATSEYGARHFSTIRSLPSLPRSEIEPKISRPVASKSVANLQFKKAVSQDEESVQSVCDFIKNNDVFSLLDLPGLKYNRKEARVDNNNIKNTTTLNFANKPGPARIDLLKGRIVGQTVRIVLLTEEVVEVNLVPKEVTISELLDIAIEKSMVEKKNKSMLCLAKMIEEEYFWLPGSENVSEHAEHGVETFYTRFLVPPCMELRRKFSEQLLHTGNYGVFRYEGKENKMNISKKIILKVSSHGLTVNEHFIEMKNIKQVSCSQTFLQVLFYEEKVLKKFKVCFAVKKTKNIHKLISHLLERYSASQKLRQKEMSNLEDLCDQLLKITKSAIKVISTPNRKRSKSADPEYLKSRKRQKLNRSLTFTDPKKPKAKTPSYQYRLYLENEEDEQYVHLEKLQMTRKKMMEKENIPRKTKITTIPNSKLEPKKPTISGPRQGPVIMGTTTLKRRRLISVTPTSHKIVCVSMNRKEVLASKIILRKSEDGLFIDSTANTGKNKLLAGDRVVAVNGRPLDDCSLDKAYFIMLNSDHLLNFILSR